MNVNKHIIVATGIIVAGGLIKVWTGPSGGNITPILMGGLVLMIPLSVLDLFGGGASKLAGGIAMLAAFTAILTQVPWNAVFKAIGVGVKTA